MRGLRSCQDPHIHPLSALSRQRTNKNIYIQLPQCYSKSGIVNTGQKIYCDLIFKANDSYIADFFENLEDCLKSFIKIYSAKILP